MAAPLGALGVAAALVAGVCGPATKTSPGAVSLASASSDVFTMAPPAPWGTTWSLNPMSASFMSSLDAFSLLPLAYAKPPKFGVYVPELATSWHDTATSITIHLRRDAKWQNGQAFTGTDVVDTLELQGTNGLAIWDEITGVTAPNAHTVVLAVKKGEPVAVLLDDILGVDPMPASVYGRFVPASLEKNLLSYWRESVTNATAATNSSAGKAVSAAFKAVEAYAPSSFVGDGPYEYVRATTSDMLVKEWKGFWGASKIHVPQIEFLNSQTSGNWYGTLLSSQVDLADGSIPYSIEERWLRTADAHYVTADNYGQFAWYFNDRRYPFKMVGVRRAIAYAINRPDVTALGNGGHSPYHPDKIPTGLISVVQDQWVSKAKLATLNPYRYDPAKAAKILRGLGFHKKGKWWFMPNGKQFKIDLDGPAGWNDSMAETLAAAKELNNFGIKTIATAADQATFWTYQNEGNFDMDWGWGGDGGLNPLAGAANVIGTNLNYTSYGNYKGDPGIGFGPIENVPGLGKVNVPQTVTDESNTVGPSGWSKFTWIWVRFMNSQLPYLPLLEKYIQFEYSTKDWTDFPARSSWIWSTMGLNYAGATEMAIADGYIRPKS